jgi:hypothetical protein
MFFERFVSVFEYFYTVFVCLYIVIECFYTVFVSFRMFLNIFECLLVNKRRSPYFMPFYDFTYSYFSTLKIAYFALLSHFNITIFVFI